MQELGMVMMVLRLDNVTLTFGALDLDFSFGAYNTR